MGKKIIILLLVFFTGAKLYAQVVEEVFNPRYDERKTVTYGFSLAVHSASYTLKYSDYFVSPDMDSVHSILPRKSPGFKLGFIVNFKLAQFLDVRVTPTVAFSEYKLEYNYVGGEQYVELVESTGVEFPLLLKYKSQRRNNTRMYIIGGITPVIEASGRSNLEEDMGRLQVDKWNTQVELGFGFDLYYPLFKFSPEIRFAYGLTDVLGPTINNKSIGLDQLKTKSLTLYFHFQ
ncbi:MAG: porin family protein [Bacteroidota bacterium]